MEIVFKISFDKLISKENVFLFRKTLKLSLAEKEENINEIANLKKTNSLIRQIKVLKKINHPSLLWIEIKTLKLERHIDDVLSSLYENPFENKDEIYLCVAIVSFLDKKYPGTASSFVKTFPSKENNSKLFFLSEFSLVNLVPYQLFVDSVFDVFKKKKNTVQKTKLLLFLVEEWNNELFSEAENTDVSFPREIRKQFLNFVLSFVETRRKRLEELNKKIVLSDKQFDICKEKIINEKYIITKTLSLICPLLGISIHAEDSEKEKTPKTIINKWLNEDERLFYENIPEIRENFETKKQKVFSIKDLKEVSTKEDVDEIAQIFLSEKIQNTDELIVFLTALDSIKNRQFSLYCRFLKIIKNNYSSLIGSLCSYIEKMLWLSIQKTVNMFIKEKVFIYFSELIKFGLIHSNFFSSQFLYCLENKNKKTLFFIYRVFLSCGRFLINNSQTEIFVKKILDVLLLEKDNYPKESEEKMYVLNILSIFERKQPSSILQKELIQEYIDKLLIFDLQQMKRFDFVFKELRKLNWKCKKTTRFLQKRLTRPWELGSFSAKNIASILARIVEYYPCFVSDIIDTVFEEVLYQPIPEEDKKAFLFNVEYLGEFYLLGFISSEEVIKPLWKFLGKKNISSFEARLGVLLISKIQKKIKKDKKSIKYFVDLIVSYPKKAFSFETLVFIDKELNNIFPGCFVFDIENITKSVSEQKKMETKDQKNIEDDFEEKLVETFQSNLSLGRKKDPKQEIGIPLIKTKLPEKEGEYIFIFKKENKKRTKNILIEK